MNKLLKYELKYKWKGIFIGTILLIGLLAFGYGGSFNNIGSRIFGKTLTFSTLPEKIMAEKMVFISSVFAIVLILWGVDLFTVYLRPLNSMLPIHRGKIVLSKIIIFITILLYIDVIFLVDMMVINYRIFGNINFDIGNYIFIGYLNILYLAQLIFIYDLIIFYKYYIENVSILYFILIATNVNPTILSLGNTIFYNKNTRLNLDNLRLQSTELVNRINGDLWNLNIVNEGLDLMTLFLGLIISIIIFIAAYKLMDEKA